VAVARALGGRPSILLADEPTGNLAAKNGAAVMQLRSESHREGATIWMVTHDARFSDRAHSIPCGYLMAKLSKNKPPAVNESKRTRWLGWDGKIPRETNGEGRSMGDCSGRI